MMGNIYFIRVGADGPIKVGFTKVAPLKRLDALQCGCPWELRLIGSIRGTKTNEKWLHDHKFTQFKMRREWFSAEILDEVHQILASDNPWPTRDLSPVDLAIWRAGSSWYLEHRVLATRDDINAARRNKTTPASVLRFLSKSEAAA